MLDAPQADPAKTPSKSKPQSPACAKKLARFCRDHDMSKATAYRLIDRGLLIAHKRLGSTVILAESEAAYVASLKSGIGAEPEPLKRGRKSS
jgi:hypothetical protein